MNVIPSLLVSAGLMDGCYNSDALVAVAAHLALACDKEECSSRRDIIIECHEEART